MLSRRCNKNFFAIVVLIALVVILSICFFDVNLVKAEDMTYELSSDSESEVYDQALLNNVLLPSELSSNTRRFRVNSHNAIQSNFDIPFRLDQVEVLMKKEYTNLDGFIDYDYFSVISNVKNIYDALVFDDMSHVNINKYRQNLVFELTNEGRSNVLQMIRELMAKDRILLVQPVYLYESESTNYVPNDEFFTQQWALQDSNSNSIQIQKAWDYTKGLSSVLVGVFDNNIQIDHPDLNYVEGNKIPDNSEGTHGAVVSGIIGAKINNAIGVAGVSNSTVCLLDRSNFVSSLQYAANNGIKIVNCSFRFVSIQTDPETGETIISNSPFNSIIYNAISSFNGLVVCSAGNNNEDTDTMFSYPASYDCDNIISVGAINSSGDKCSFSNYGATSVDIFAPGENILSIGLNDGYLFGNNGTSYAAPFVSGVAALMLSLNPNLNSTEIKSIILNCDTNVSELSDLCVSGGILNAYKVILNTPQSNTIFDNFGYDGETFNWGGKVELSYLTSTVKTVSGMLVFSDNTDLNISVITKEFNNLILTMNGSITINLKRSNGNIVQQYNSTVEVNILNQETVDNRCFTIDTSSLDTGTYSLELVSHFTRGSEYSEDHTLSYNFGVNKPITIMDGFGFLSSWYVWKGEVNLSNDYLHTFSRDSNGKMTVNKNTSLVFSIATDSAFNAVKEITGTIDLTLRNSAGEIIQINGSDYHSCSLRVGLVSNTSLSNSVLTLNTADLVSDTYTLTVNCMTNRDGIYYSNSTSFVFVFNKPSSACVSSGTLITLSDGTQVSVENLTGNENLLVWNILTGQFDSAPILFIDNETEAFYNIIKLSFADSTVVSIIDEHAFYDLDLNKYVYLSEDAASYIGHKFNKQTYDESGNMIWIGVELVDVDIIEEETIAWSPVTYSHLCYYVDGMLSMPGATEGFVNIFDVNVNTMMVDQEQMQLDIAQYGLYSYNEFAELFDISEEIFNAFNGQYLKVSLGKGLTTEDSIRKLIDRYSVFFN